MSDDRQTKVVGYVRVSTEEQAKSGLSLEMQRQRVAAYCVAHNMELVGIIEDAGGSGKDLNRPGFQQAMETLKAGTAKALLVLKLDRLTRNVVDFYRLADEFSESDWSILSVEEHIDTGTPMGRFIAGIMVCCSQLERELIADRTTKALGQKRERGERTGGACVRQDEPDPKNPGKTKGDTLRANLAAGRAIAHAKKRAMAEVGNLLAGAMR